jgi:hypothetical protein
LTEEKEIGVEPSAATMNFAAAPQAIPAMVDSAAAAPLVLSQAPPVSPSEAKPTVDKPSSVVASPFAEMK